MKLYIEEYPKQPIYKTQESGFDFVCEFTYNFSYVNSPQVRFWNSELIDFEVVDIENGDLPSDVHYDYLKGSAFDDAEREVLRYAEKEFKLSNPDKNSEYDVTVTVKGYVNYSYVGSTIEDYDDLEITDYSVDIQEAPITESVCRNRVDEGVAASLLTIKNQLMNKLGSAFKAIGGSMNPKVTVYREDDPETSFDITTDGKNVDITPKYDGIPDTAHKKRGIAFMRAVNVLYDFIINTLGGDSKQLAAENYKKSNRNKRTK